jgi:hypothetical protein
MPPPTPTQHMHARTQAKIPAPPPTPTQHTNVLLSTGGSLRTVALFLAIAGAAGAVVGAPGITKW